jgi:2-methylcitrate dehydratase PrpD
VNAKVNTEIREDEVKVIIALKGGERIEEHVAHSIGSPENPMTDDFLIAKYRQITEGVIDREQQEQLLSALWLLEKVPNFKTIASLMQGTATP